VVVVLDLCFDLGVIRILDWFMAVAKFFWACFFPLVWFGLFWCWILVLFLVGVEFFGSYFLVGILFWVVEIV
jgi:hypothetical protein